MSKIFKFTAALLVASLLQACVADRTGSRLGSVEKISTPYESGSIFKAGINERPLYEDRRARNVGDIVLMNVVDTMSPPKKAADAAKGNDGGDGSDAERRRRRSREDDEDMINIASETLLGPIPMQVTEVLDNGNLMVEGGRQVAVDEDLKYLHVSGMVDPIYLAGGNTVQSTQMTNVLITIDHVRIRADGTTSRINEGNSIFGKYFHSVNPR